MLYKTGILLLSTSSRNQKRTFEGGTRRSNLAGFTTPLAATRAEEEESVDEGSCLHLMSRP